MCDCQPKERPAFALRATAWRPSLTSLREALPACQAVAGEASDGWCERRDLNPHPWKDWFLRPARLPFRHARMKWGSLQAMILSFRLTKAASCRMNEES